MINIKTSVEKLINDDLEGKNALARGILNLSQYARSIQKDVEKAAKKPVSVQSIVVTLARLEKKLKVSHYLPDIHISQLSVHSPIVQIVYLKTQENLDSLTESIKKTKGLEGAFFCCSTSTKDIALIMSQSLEKEILKKFPGEPKLVKRELAAVSIRFDESYVPEANVGLSLLHKISLRNVALDAAVTTYNEFTLVFEEHFLHHVIEVLKPDPVSDT